MVRPSFKPVFPVWTELKIIGFCCRCTIVDELTGEVGHLRRRLSGKVEGLRIGATNVRVATFKTEIDDDRGMKSKADALGDMGELSD